MSGSNWNKKAIPDTKYKENLEQFTNFNYQYLHAQLKGKKLNKKYERGLYKINNESENSRNKLLLEKRNKTQ